MTEEENKMRTTLLKKLLSLSLALTLLLGCASIAEEAAPQLEHDVVVLFTSDVHCGIESGFGYAGLAMMRDAYRNAGNRSRDHFHVGRKRVCEVAGGSYQRGSDLRADSL